MKFTPRDHEICALTSRAHEALSDARARFTAFQGEAMLTPEARTYQELLWRLTQFELKTKQLTSDLAAYLEEPEL